jgi:hypothetical protein
VERPSLNDKPLIVERRSLRSALRAPVETTEIAICDRPARQGERLGEGARIAIGPKRHFSVAMAPENSSDRLKGFFK